MRIGLELHRIWTRAIVRPQIMIFQSFAQSPGQDTPQLLSNLGLGSPLCGNWAENSCVLGSLSGSARRDVGDIRLEV